MTTADKLKNLRVPSIADVQAARARIAAMTHVTPVMNSSHIDRLADRRIVFKCENLQKTGSFKSRGALNAVMNLSDAERRAGVDPEFRVVHQTFEPRERAASRPLKSHRYIF